MATFFRFILLLICIWSTVWTINYKYTTAIKLFKFNEEEEKKNAIFALVVLHIVIISWTTYFILWPA